MSEERTKVRYLPFNKLNVEGGLWHKQMFFFLFFFLFIYLIFFLHLLYSIVLFPRIEPVGNPTARSASTLNCIWDGSSTELFVETSRKMDWTRLSLLSRLKKKYVGCIELLFKLYRATCRY